MKYLVSSLLLILILSSCATTVESPVTELEKTWKSANIMLPARYSSTAMTQLAPGFYEYSRLDDWSRDVQEKYLEKNVEKVPVVLHMHGCAGIGHSDSSWADVYADMGYLTILPNSFRRSRRERMCGQGRWGYRSQLRIEEINYALQQILKIPWVDVNRLFLSGHSEGGNALSFYKGEQFAAYIIIGTNCRHAGGSPRAPRSIPVLNIYGSEDRYSAGGGCNIYRSVGGSGRVLVEGAGHDVSQEEKARAGAREFLENCCNN